VAENASIANGSGCIISVPDVVLPGTRTRRTETKFSFFHSRERGDWASLRRFGLSDIFCLERAYLVSHVVLFCWLSSALLLLSSTFLLPSFCFLLPFSCSCETKKAKGSPLSAAFCWNFSAPWRWILTLIKRPPMSAVFLFDCLFDCLFD
jgi:hypothetical protein